MTGYWDIHNHILPGVDDGSGCMRETMEMLEEEYRQGVRHIVFTPHYRRDMFAIPREEIQTVYARVCEMAADRFPEMEFYLGCEYYIHSDASVERLRGNPKYYMAGSRTVLMEFAYEASYAWIMQTVSEVRQMGLQPVLAHAERYECLYKGRDRVAELKTQGAYIQINCESILGKCGRKAKHFCMKLLKEDQIDLMASDAHDTEYRIVNIREAAELISRKFGQEKVETISTGDTGRRNSRTYCIGLGAVGRMDPGWKNYGWFYSGSICKDEFTEIMRIEKWKRQYKICCNVCEM